MQRNLVYGQGSGRDLHLDLFRPRDAAGARPAVVFLHGGGWRSGNKGQFARQSAYLAGKGYVCACAEYRLSGEAKFPAAVEDAKCAMRWMRSQAEELKVDPERIAVAGGSAGGHLALMVAASAGVKELEGQGGHAQFGSQANAVVGFNPVADFSGMARARRAVPLLASFLGVEYEQNPDVYAKASPVTYVDEKHPPCLILHGDEDQTVPYEQSVAYIEKLKALGVEAELFTAEGAGHGFFNRDPWYQPTLEKMEAFLGKHLVGE